MLQKASAWGISIILILGAVFVGVTYDVIGVFGAGALSLLTGIVGFIVIKLDTDRATKILVMIACFGFTGRRVWDMAIVVGALPWTADAPGDARAFTPVASYDAVRDFVHAEARLVGLKAKGVRSDGTVDVTACEIHSPCVRYQFLAPRRYPIAESTEGAPEAAGPGAHLYDVELHRESDSYLTEFIGDEDELEGQPWPYHRGMSKPMERDHRGVPKKTPKVIPDPTCTFADLWKQALVAGQPKDAEAAIVLDEQGYHLRIGKEVHLRYKTDCKLQAVVRLQYMIPGRREATPKLFIDGKPAGDMKYVFREGQMRMLWLEPGKHTFRATLKGRAPRSVTAILKAGDYRKVELE